MHIHVVAFPSLAGQCRGARQSPAPTTHKVTRACDISEDGARLGVPERLYGSDVEAEARAIASQESTRSW